MKKFDARARLQERLQVTLPDGSEHTAVVVTPDVRRTLQKVDIKVGEHGARIQRQAKEQQDDADAGRQPEFDPERLKGTYEDVNVVQDGVYHKLQLLLVASEGGKAPTLAQLMEMGDPLAGELLALITAGEADEDPTPAGTTGT